MYPTPFRFYFRHPTHLKFEFGDPSQIRFEIEIENQNEIQNEHPHYNSPDLGGRSVGGDGGWCVWYQ